MPISVLCPACGAKTSIPDQAAGSIVKCPTCQGQMRIAAKAPTLPSASTKETKQESPAKLQDPAGKSQDAGPTIVVTCSSCQTKLGVPSNLAGRQAKCPKCGALAAIPRADMVTSQPKQAESGMKEGMPEQSLRLAPALAPAPEQKTNAIAVSQEPTPLVPAPFKWSALNRKKVLILGGAVAALAVTVVLFSCIIGIIALSQRDPKTATPILAAEKPNTDRPGDPDKQTKKPDPVPSEPAKKPPEEPKKKEVPLKPVEATVANAVEFKAPLEEGSRKELNAFAQAMRETTTNEFKFRELKDKTFKTTFATPKVNPNELSHGWLFGRNCIMHGGQYDFDTEIYTLLVDYWFFFMAKNSIVPVDANDHWIPSRQSSGARPSLRLPCGTGFAR